MTRVLDARRHLLDRQVKAPGGGLVCKVDDLELQPDDSGQLHVTALLAGPAALGPRVGGRLGRWMTAVAHRLHPDADPGPARIDFGVVTGVGNAVDIRLDPEQTEADRLEKWVRDHVIDRVPGAGHATE